VLDNLSVAPSPLWLQVRLLAVGCKPINNLVDSTNYVMFEYGNPMHLFDRRKLSHHTITVRSARQQEPLKTLDNEVRLLDAEDVVIAAGTEPVALAGVIGGEAAEIDDDTTQGYLEVGNFNAFKVQETARRLNIRTESSLRFSKGIDPNLATTAAQRAVTLLGELASAAVISAHDEYPRPRKPKAITFNPTQISRVTGMPVAEKQAVDALQRLRFQITQDSKEEWKVGVPSDRLDVVADHDVVEEVVRLIGLHEIKPATLHSLSAVPLPHHIYWREVVRDVLVKLGLTEVYNASFEPARYAGSFGLSVEPHITVVNPPAPELSQLRTSLLPGLIANLAANRETVQRNAHQGKESALFEIGNVYRPGTGKRVSGIIEEENLAGVIVGATPTVENIAIALGEQLGIADMTIRPAHHQISEQLKFRLPITSFELNLTQLLQQVEGTVGAAKSLSEIESQHNEAASFVSFARYPAVYRDLSVLVDTNVTVEQVQEIIERVGGHLVTDVDLFDIYSAADDTAATEEPARQSVAFHIAYQSPGKTLTDEEVALLHNRIVQALQDELDATARE
jgi:phenylalanyl-tRNA synthetase beta chain